ncbi:MAG: aminotransferase class I/II-fold pyridoxal phosphate-dependent enzyme [Planctomycetota bacterium]
MDRRPVPDTSLELSGRELRRLVDLAMDRIAPHLDSLAAQPASHSEDGAAAARAVIEPLPEVGVAPEGILDELFERHLRTTYNTASPGCLAYIPGGGLPHAAVADLIADAVNRYVGVWIAAPALAQIEATVVRWFTGIVGYGAEAGGFLTTGGSLANWSALVTARRCRLPADFLRATIYTSSQAHHSIAKAAVLAGFPPESVREIDVDAEFRVRLDRLEEAIAGDRAAGRVPFALVGHAGTVNTGAVDDLAALADLAARENLWLHVDAAYGGFFLLTARDRAAMGGIERADSITLDPHKGLFLPYGTGCLLARRRADLERAFGTRGAYMPEMQRDPEFVDFCQISPELSRDFRGLRLWLPIKMHGIGPFRRNLDEKLDLARWAAAELHRLDAEIPDRLEIVAAPQLSILAFRLARPGLSEAELTALNERLRTRINAGKRVFLTPTTLDGRHVIRICVLHFRTHRDRMEECLAAIREGVREV